jgi:hypothetical protein
MNDTQQPKQRTSTYKVVLDQIQSRTVVMRPKVYFTLRLIGVFVLAVIILFLAIFIVGMISFSIRVSGHIFLLGKGLQGVMVFLELFPWIPLAVTMGMLVLLVKLLRTFSFGYRQPIAYVLIFVGLFCFGAGVALDRGTRMNDVMFDSAMRAPRPGPIDTIYRGARRVPPSSLSFPRETRRQRN